MKSIFRIILLVYIIYINVYINILILYTYYYTYYNEIICALRYMVYIHISLNHKYHKYVCFSYSTSFHTVRSLSNVYIYIYLKGIIYFS